MSFVEMCLYIDGINEREKSEWERTRHLMWSVLQPYLKGKKTPKDILPFSWEQDNTEEELTDEDREAIIAQGRAFEMQMKNERINSNETHS